MKGTLNNAFGYQGDNMNLPVADVASAAGYYQQMLGFHVESRSDLPPRAVVLARDSVRIKLVENGGDPTQDGCAFHVTGLDALLEEFNANGLGKDGSAVSTEFRDGSPWRVFFVVAPDGLCYWFGERQGS